jgi:zinc transport system substrate-binding protein
MTQRLQNSLFMVSWLLLIIGCDQPIQSEPQVNDASSGKPSIVVTSWPLLQMTQMIVGDAAHVNLIVPANTVSRNWSPTGDDVRTMQRAQLILLSGAGYEPWKHRVSLPGSRLRDTAAGYYDQFIRIPDAVSHQHGPEGPHHHPGTVWATWLDPELCAAQLHLAAVNCEKLMPQQAVAIRAAESKMSAEIGMLNSMIASVQATNGGKNLVVFSDAPHYQYLIHRLGWTLQYLHWDEDESLSEAEKTEFIEAIKSDDGDSVRIFLMDSRRPIEAEGFVRAAGGIVVRIDLCETPDPEPLSLPSRLKSNLILLQAELANL